MAVSEGNVNMYFKLYLLIKNEILLGDLPPGSKVPNIIELHQRHKVSEGTVRKALELLQKEGFILKKRGSGTYVRDDVEHLAWTPKSSYKELLAAVHQQKIHQIFEGWVDAPRRVHNLFCDQQDALQKGKIYYMRRLFTNLQDNRRRSLFDMFIPARVVKNVGLEKLRNDSVHDAVIKMEDKRTVRILQTVRPWVCDSKTGDLLGLAEGAPVFHRAWNVVDGNKRTLIYSEWLSTASALVREITIK